MNINAPVDSRCARMELLAWFSTRNIQRQIDSNNYKTCRKLGLTNEAIVKSEDKRIIRNKTSDANDYLGNRWSGLHWKQAFNQVR